MPFKVDLDVHIDQYTCRYNHYLKLFTRGKHSRAVELTWLFYWSLFWDTSSPAKLKIIIALNGIMWVQKSHSYSEDICLADCLRLWLSSGSFHVTRMEQRVFQKVGIIEAGSQKLCFLLSSSAIISSVLIWFSSKKVVFWIHVRRCMNWFSKSLIGMHG